jgi:hypothetical protein
MEDRLDHLDPMDVLTPITRTFVLSTFAVAGMFLALYNAPCDFMLVGEFIVMSCGALLLVQVTRAQLARYYPDQSASSVTPQS